MKNKGDYILVDTKNNVINYPPCLYAFGVEIFQNQYKIIKKVIEPTYRGRSLIMILLILFRL